MNAELSQRAARAMLGIDFDQVSERRQFVRALEAVDSFADLPKTIQQMIVDGERRLRNA